MTIATGRSIWGQGAVWVDGMVPDLSRGYLAPRRAKMALGTADSRTATKEILSVAAGTLINILRRANPMEGSTLFVNPGLP